jgi:Transposase DDE domain
MERELWKILYNLATHLDKGFGKWLYSTADVLAAYFWAVVHDRPQSWGVDRNNWPADLLPVLLPAQSTLSRRMRRPEMVELMLLVEEHLKGLLMIGYFWVSMIDGKALAVSGVSKDPDVGYGRGAGGWQKGYKFHAIWGKGPMPVAWGLAAMNVSEKIMARHLITSSPGGGYLLGDTQFDVNYLYDASGASGYQLVVRKTSHRGRGGLGHRRQSEFRLRSIELLKTSFGRLLYRQRQAIERRFSALTTFGGGLAPLPAWVRRFPRVRNWVHAKLLIAGVRWLLKHNTEVKAFA